MTDRDFLSEFESAAIPRERWTHREHVRIAFLYLRDLAFAEALLRLRSGIQALNRANGVLDTSTSGYHETLTVAWARVVASAIARGAAEDFDSFALRNPGFFSKDLLRAYYSNERLFASEARESFVEPDIAPLPGSEVVDAR